MVRAPDIGLGLRVRDVRLQDTPAFAAGEQPFRVASPVFIKHAVARGPPADHLLPGHALADELLTATLRHKLRQASLADTGAAVRFDPAHLATAKSKLFKSDCVELKCLCQAAGCCCCGFNRTVWN